MLMSFITHMRLLSFLIGIFAEIYIPQSRQQEKRTVWHPDDEELNPHTGIPKYANGYKFTALLDYCQMCYGTAKFSSQNLITHVTDATTLYTLIHPTPIPRLVHLLHLI